MKYREIEKPSVKMENPFEQKPSLKEHIAEGARFCMKLSAYALGITAAALFGIIGIKGLYRMFIWLWNHI